MIKTDRLKLSIITMDNLDAVYKTMNYKKTADMIHFFQWPMTHEQARKWCERSVAGYKNKTEYHFIASLKNQPVGCMGLLLDGDNPGSAEIGCWIDEELQKQGFASELLQAGIRYGSQELGIQNIHATAAVDNEASQNMLRKNGFQEQSEIDIPLADGSCRPSIKFMLDTNWIKKQSM